FIDEILALTGNEEDQALAKLQSRYNALLPLKVLLENGQRTKSGVDSNGGGHPEDRVPMSRLAKGNMWELWTAWDTAPQTLDHLQEWPAIRHLACELFQHPSFDRNTW